MAYNAYKIPSHTVHFFTPYIRFNNKTNGVGLRPKRPKLELSLG